MVLTIRLDHLERYVSLESGFSITIEDLRLNIIRDERAFLSLR